MKKEFLVGDTNWNSDKQCLGNLSCRDAAAFITSFGSAFRAMALVQQYLGSKGVIDQSIRMLQAQLDYLNAKEVDEKQSEEILSRTLSTIGQAMACLGILDPNSSGWLAGRSLRKMIDASKEAGEEKFANSVVRFKVRNLGTPIKPKIQIETELTPMAKEEVEQEQASPSLSEQSAQIADKIISDVVDQVKTTEADGKS
jgi:hypothetical protein